MTTTKTTVNTTPVTEEVPATAKTPENKLQALLKNQYIVKQCSENNGLLRVTVLINKKQNIVTACSHVYNLFKKQYNFTVAPDFSAIKPDTDFNFGKSTIYFSTEINSLQFFLKIDELQNGVKEEVKFTNLDIISRIDKFELTTVEHKNNECCYVTVKPCFNEKTGLTHEQIFNALTGVYDTDSEEKKFIAKLLQPITTKALAKHIIAKTDLNFVLTHTEILLRVFKNEKEFATIKSRRISIFDMIEFDKNVLKAFHNALADNRQDAAAAVEANKQIEKLIAEIQKYIVYPCSKPVYIDTTKKGLFYRLIKRSVNKATATHTTYNKTNVNAFINGYVLASYNNRLKDYLNGIKPPKNN